MTPISLGIIAVFFGLSILYVKIAVNRKNIERAIAYPLAVKWMKTYNRMVSWLWSHQEFLREDNEKAIAHPRIQELFREFYEVHTEVMIYFPDPEFDEHIKQFMRKYLKDFQD